MLKAEIGSEFFSNSGDFQILSLIFNQALSNSINLPSFKVWSYLAFTMAFVKACGILILSLGNAIIVAHLFCSQTTDTQRELFSKIPNFWAWADKLSPKFFGVFTLFRSSTCALTGFFWLLSHMIYLKLTKVLKECFLYQTE